MELIKQGAEAKLFKHVFFGRGVIIKQRFPKKYRHAILDQQLTRKRTLQEVRSMLRCHKVGIKIPIVYFVNHHTNEIYMEEINNSCTLKFKIDKLLQDNSDFAIDTLKLLVKNTGMTISKMHASDIIHGDLTTSNMLVKNVTNELYAIDFGLSSVSVLSEDMAVDLYVLERAFLSTHPGTEELFSLLLDSYVNNTPDKKKNKDVMNKLEEVRSRGRKRVMVG